MSAQIEKISRSLNQLEGRNGESYIIIDVNDLLGEDGAKRVEQALQRGGGFGGISFMGGEKALLFQYPGNIRDQRPVGQGAFSKQKGESCWAGWSTVLLLMSEKDYEMVGGDLEKADGEAKIGNAVFIVLQAAGLLTVNKDGFSFAGQKIC